MWQVALSLSQELRQDVVIEDEYGTISRLSWPVCNHLRLRVRKFVLIFWL